MSTLDFTKNSIAAVNPLFGVVNFIVLSLPYGWKVRGEKYPPAVDKVVRIKNVKWVSAGKIISLYYSPMVAGTIDIDVYEGDKMGKWNGSDIIINGHRGCVKGYKVKKGIIKKRWVEVIEVGFYCDRTNRSIRIRMYGLSLLEHLDEILKSIPSSMCH